MKNKSLLHEYVSIIAAPTINEAKNASKLRASASRVARAYQGLLNPPPRMLHTTWQWVRGIFASGVLAESKAYLAEFDEDALRDPAHKNYLKELNSLIRFLKPLASGKDWGFNIRYAPRFKKDNFRTVVPFDLKGWDHAGQEKASLPSGISVEVDLGDEDAKNLGSWTPRHFRLKIHVGRYFGWNRRFVHQIRTVSDARNALALLRQTVEHELVHMAQSLLEQPFGTKLLSDPIEYLLQDEEFEPWVRDQITTFKRKWRNHLKTQSALPVSSLSKDTHTPEDFYAVFVGDVKPRNGWVVDTSVFFGALKKTDISRWEAAKNILRLELDSGGFFSRVSFA